MHPALWISKTGLEAQQKDISVISNNLANVNTQGFKKTRAVFQDLMYQKHIVPGTDLAADTPSPSGLLIGTGVKVTGTTRDFSQGNLAASEGLLDLAINGRGFFKVLKEDGSAAYTRDGRFSLDQTGKMVNISGLALDPAINIPQGTLSITIGVDGSVSAVTANGSNSPVLVGNITISDFVNPGGLEPIGENLYVETVASGGATAGQPGANGLGNLKQGFTEASNVNVVEELVSMIQTQRAYEMNAKSVQSIDKMLEFVVQTI